MREILFRGKDIYRWKWIEGAYVHLNTGNAYICDGTVWIGTLQPCKNEVLPETVGQYTGLTDKNGKKIFEGDIVRLTFSEEVVGKIICDINYYFEVYLFGKTTHKSLSDYSPYDLEILGNIHDNPELLEVQNEQG